MTSLADFPGNPWGLQPTKPGSVFALPLPHGSADGLFLADWVQQTLGRSDPRTAETRHQGARFLAITDTALRAHDLDEARAIEAKQRAEELLASNIDKVSEAEALAELVRAAAQLKMIAKLRKTKG